MAGGAEYFTNGGGGSDLLPPPKRPSRLDSSGERPNPPPRTLPAMPPIVEATLLPVWCVVVFCVTACVLVIRASDCIWLAEIKLLMDFDRSSNCLAEPVPIAAEAPLESCDELPPARIGSISRRTTSPVPLRSCT